MQLLLWNVCVEGGGGAARNHHHGGREPQRKGEYEREILSFLMAYIEQLYVQQVRGSTKPLWGSMRLLIEIACQSQPLPGEIAADSMTNLTVSNPLHMKPKE